MKRMTTAALAALTLSAVLLAATGCTRVPLQDSPTTKTFTESSAVPLKGATQLDAVIEQGVGDLTIRSSSETSGAVETLFTFAPESWRPEVTSSVEGTKADVRIAQPQSSQAPLFSNVRNSWVISLPGGVGTDLTLQLGVGTSNVDLRGVEIANLHALTGVGDTTIDLSGPRTADLGARIEAGVGKLTVRVPKSVGVRVTGRQDGLGKFSANGFTAQGDTWVNEAYRGPGPKIDIDLVRGVGDVMLVMAD